MHHLYAITNLINGKIYIGQTVSPKDRWYQHRCGNEQVIDKSIKKYGAHNFTFEIIGKTWSYILANGMEQSLIVLFESHTSTGKGYNVSWGGENAPKSEEFKQMMRNWHASLSEEEKAERAEKHRAAMFRQFDTQGHPSLGQKRTPEQRQNMSHAQQLRHETFIYTDEMRQTISEGQKRRGPHTKETIAKRKASVAATVAKRQEEATISGELKCNAPGCEVVGMAAYRFVNDIRYCLKHAQRVERLGTTELLPFVAWNKGKPASETTKQKLRGRVPVNKVVPTQEQISIILSDPKGSKKLAKVIGIGARVIARIRREARRKQPI